MSKLRNLKLQDIQHSIMMSSYGTGNDTGSVIDGGSFPDIVVYGTYLGSGSGSDINWGSFPEVVFYGSWRSDTCGSCGNKLYFGICPYCGYSGSVTNTGSGETPIAPPPPKPKDEKKPESRLDCLWEMGNPGRSVESVMRQTGIINYMDTLRTKLTGDREYGLSISQDADSSWVYQNKIYEGVAGSNEVEIDYNSKACVYTIHTHYPGLNSAPSCGDIISTIKIFKEVKAANGNYKGTVVLGHNGSEYLISVNNPVTLQHFCDTVSSDFYVRGSNNYDFQDNSIWDRTYTEVKGNLLNQKFSADNAASYALSYVLDIFNMGLKILHKEKDSSFKEQKTLSEQNGKKVNYKPMICP